MPKERPILFSGSMIKAILEGRKIKTRRIVKPQPPEGFRLWGRCIDEHASWTDHPLQGEKGNIVRATCPYGKPGDTLWVRETFGPGFGDNPVPTLGYVAYRADGEYPARLKDTHVWRPSIFMPRWASRITLKITEVRAERLQDISEADAIAEGVTLPERTVTHYDGIWKHHFRTLWDALNAKRGYGWDVDPWVWVIRFEKV